MTECDRRGESGPCDSCNAAGPDTGPYTNYYKTLLCPVCLDLAQRAMDLDHSDGDDVAAEHHGTLVDWSAFWSRDRSDPEWLIEPVIPRGRSVAAYAPGGEGKSELALAIAAAAATGRRILGRAPGRPVHTLYLDVEQTEDDLWDRLVDLGYGPDDDLDPLRYYLLPDLSPLDTAAGGQQLHTLTRHHHADLVVIDTTGRVLQGPENDADTIRAYHRHTGKLLKADGRAVFRLDHAGKDLARGQRGTSAKNDDVDIVWLLTRRDGGARLKAQKRRASWVPEQVDLVRLTDPVSYELAHQSWPAGTKGLAATLDRLGVPATAGRPTARQALKEAGEKAHNTLLEAALRWRKQDPETPTGSAAGSSPVSATGSAAGSEPESLTDQGPVSAAGSSGQPPPVTTGSCPPLKGGSARTQSEPDPLQAAAVHIGEVFPTAEEIAP